jgi:hypothetical protein
LRIVRILFLDFDGVLNSLQFTRSEAAAGRTYSITPLDPAAVRVLNWIIEKTDARIVITSSKRIINSTEKLVADLWDAGFCYPNVVLGITPTSAPLTPEVRDWDNWTPQEKRAHLRGNDIQAWLNQAREKGMEIESFAILDDDSDMAHLMDRLVRVNHKRGLTTRYAELVVELLTQ